jgi:hypothetical protein
MLYAELQFCVQEDPPGKRSEHSHTFVGKLAVLAFLIFVRAESIGPIWTKCVEIKGEHVGKCCYRSDSVFYYFPPIYDLVLQMVPSFHVSQ